MRIELDDNDIRKIIADKLKIDPDDIEFDTKSFSCGDITEVEVTKVIAIINTEIV